MNQFLGYLANQMHTFLPCDSPYKPKQGNIVIKFRQLEVFLLQDCLRSQVIVICFFHYQLEPLFSSDAVGKGKRLWESEENGV